VFGCEGGGDGGSRVETTENDHLQLAFGREGGGGGRGVGRAKKTTSSSRLNAKEVVRVGDVSKRQKKPPPACVSMQGQPYKLELYMKCS